MQDTAATLLVLGFAFVAANLPFMTERILIAGPRQVPKAPIWRLVELLLLGALSLGIGWFIEGRQGQVAPQGWEFYVAYGCLFLTFGFPGFVWRYLRRGKD